VDYTWSTECEARTDNATLLLLHFQDYTPGHSFPDNTLLTDYSAPESSTPTPTPTLTPAAKVKVVTGEAVAVARDRYGAHGVDLARSNSIRVAHDPATMDFAGVGVTLEMIVSGLDLESAGGGSGVGGRDGVGTLISKNREFSVGLSDTHIWARFTTENGTLTFEAPRSTSSSSASSFSPSIIYIAVTFNTSRVSIYENGQHLGTSPDHNAPGWEFPSGGEDIVISDPEAGNTHGFRLYYTRVSRGSRGAEEIATPDPICKHIAFSRGDA
jgi:hypothetical protein